jgi:predicted DNA binding CopG/RHH family protein
MSRKAGSKPTPPTQLKPIPVFDSDEEVEHFVDTADLSEYDLSGFVPARSVLHFTESRVSLRLPSYLLERVKETAAHKGVSYQSYIRDVLAKAVAEDERAQEKAGRE